MDLYSVEKPRPSDLLHYGTNAILGDTPGGLAILLSREAETFCRE